MVGTVVLGVVAIAFVLSIALPTTRRLWAFSFYGSKHLFLYLTQRRCTKAMAARRLFEDLGPTFIKFGQIVASSSGMFPDPYVKEFQKCLDRVREFPFEDVEQILREELGEGAARLTDIDPKPLASASIAQVHTALLDGKDRVVLKVQRPGIQRRIASDMRLLHGLAATIQRLVPDAELANPVGVVDDFADTLQEELDFRKEAANLDRFNQIMADLGYADIRAPRPIHDLTTPRVLVMERFYGTRVDDIERIRQQGLARAEQHLVKGLRAWFQCVLLHGFFHGDVHAGNLMLLDDETIGFLDFGIVGRFDDQQRQMVTDYIISLAIGDYQQMADVIFNMGGVPRHVDPKAFASDLKLAFSPLREKTMGTINYAELVPEIHRVATRHRMRQPKEFVLITKQLLYFDRYAKMIAPDLNIFTDPRLIMSLGEDLARAKAAAL